MPMRAVKDGILGLRGGGESGSESEIESERCSR